MDDPIINAIEEGRFTTAKHDLNAKLKRFPEKSYYLAVNCYFLAHTGNIASSEAHCKSLKAKIPSDTQALEILARTYVKLGHPSDANEIYENAVKKYPSSELLLTWFKRNIGLYDLKNGQKAAVLLRKHAKSNRSYTIRAAFLTYLWSIQCPLEKEATMNLKLANQIILEASPLQLNQERFVQMVILERMQKHEEIVQLLAPLDQKELELTIAYLKALAMSENWRELFRVCEHLLFKEKFNDYDTWRYLIRAAKNLDMAKQEILCLIELNSRNSFMASIEVARVFDSGLEDAVFSYYDAFSTKPCFVHDLSLIDLPVKFFERVNTDFATLMAKDVISEKEASKLANLLKLRLKENPGLSVQWSDFAKFDNLALTEVYLITMIRDIAKDPSPQKLVEHIVYLEHFAKKDPQNYKVKLWLMNLYTCINASSMAVQMYTDLKVRMTQHDTLSHKLDLEPSLGNLNELVQIYRFYLTSDSEMEEYLQKGFDTELYSKLEDFYKFGKRLNSSLSRHLLIVRILQISRMLNHSYYNYFHKILVDAKPNILPDTFEISENRDFSTDYNLGCHLPRISILQDEEYKRGKEYVKLYYLKELLIVERNEAEIGKLLKSFNKILSNSSFWQQLTPFEHHLFKLYLSLFKTTKSSNEKDKALELSFLVKNLEFNKLKTKFLDSLPELSNRRNQILVGLSDFCKVCELLLGHVNLNKVAKQLEKEVQTFNPSASQIQALKEIKAQSSFEHLPNDFVETTFEFIEEGLKKSTFKPR